jgi:hypothetical protein
VSLDLDVIDQAFAPGVSAMNPCGWSPARAENWVRAAGAEPDVRAFDIMELSPGTTRRGVRRASPPASSWPFSRGWRSGPARRSGTGSRTSCLSGFLLVRRGPGSSPPSRPSHRVARPASPSSGEGPGEASGGQESGVDVLGPGETVDRWAPPGPGGSPPGGKRRSVGPRGRGRVLLPGSWMPTPMPAGPGSASHEWERRLRGASYQEILAAGGGILSTVQAVRAPRRRSSRELRGRLDRALTTAPPPWR